MTAFYYYFVNHQSGLQRNTFSKSSFFFDRTKYAINYVISSEVYDGFIDQAMKPGKLAIRPWLSCPYNKHTLPCQQHQLVPVPELLEPLCIELKFMVETQLFSNVFF